jgi:hypothetical protein
MPDKRLRKFKIVRWWFGGVWILMHDGQWLHGGWSEYLDPNQYFSYSGGIFHRTYVGIVKIEDYT